MLLYFPTWLICIEPLHMNSPKRHNENTHMQHVYSYIPTGIEKRQLPYKTIGPHSCQNAFFLICVTLFVRSLYFLSLQENPIKQSDQTLPPMYAYIHKNVFLWLIENYTLWLSLVIVILSFQSIKQKEQSVSLVQLNALSTADEAETLKKTHVSSLLPRHM